MTNCQDRLNELTYTADRILDEDLAALKRVPDRSRIERYNDIKADEEALTWDFGKECPDFLTDEETTRLRGELRLARLLLAASFYAKDELPAPMAGDFVEAELQAVVDFDRYKQFDALNEQQIERRIRRMEGEVYELVREYTSTQIANVDELIDSSEVQQDVIERLVERYDDRRERIRQGFFVYVETHGLEHMVESIEAAVEAVADAKTERERVRATLQAELRELEESLETGFRSQQRTFESELRRIERNLASETVDIDEIRTHLESVGSLDDDGLGELRDAIERTRRLESTLDEQIEELETARETAAETARDTVKEEAREVVQAELERLEEQRSELRAEVQRLQQEREQLESTHERLEAERDDLESKVEDLQLSADSPRDEIGIDGSDVVTAATARLFEMDYVGRFDTSMHEAETIELPDGTFDVPDGYWEGRSRRRSAAPRMIQLLEEAGMSRARIDTYPTNPATRYEITESRYLGLSEATEMLIEATVCSDLEAHADSGFDATPADIDDLLELVNDAVREAELKEAPYLLGIASPTGWTDQVERRISDDDIARTTYSRQVSICLVDLRDGRVIYDQSDPLVSDNVEFFERAIGAERAEECASVVRATYVDSPARETVGLGEVCDEHGFERHIVKRAFERLESAGEAEQFYVDEDGLAIDVG
jgi:hypothetical protein